MGLLALLFLAAFCSMLASLVSPRRPRYVLPPWHALGIVAAATALGAFTSEAHAQTLHFSGALSTVSSDLNAPNGMTVDAGGNIYIADSGNSRVLKETLSGSTYTESTVADSSTISRVDGVAVDASGNLYLAEFYAGRIVKETLSGGIYTATPVNTSALNQPSEVALDSQGNLYIADSGNNRVLKETPMGNGFSESTVTTASSLNWPIGLAIDSSGSVFIGDFRNNRVLKESPSGNGYAESVVDSNLNMPARIAFDPSGNLIVADYGDKRIVKETLSGGSYTQSTLVAVPQASPTGVAVDTSGNPYVVASAADLVLKLQVAGADFSTVNAGTISSAFSLVFTFDTAGTLGNTVISTQGTPGLDFAAGPNTSCTAGKTFSAGESCIVAVTFTPAAAGARYGSAVLEDSSGHPLATGFVQGNGAGPQVSFSPGVQSVVVDGLQNPRAVTVDAAGNVYIADTDQQFILKETTSGGAYVRSQLNQSSLLWPCGVAVDGAGNVYINDTFHGRILKETLQGGTYTESTVVSSGLSGAVGLVADGFGNLYIANNENNQILEEVLTPSGYVAQQLPFQGLSQVEGLAVDEGGDVYIADAGNNRILKETLSGGTYTQSTVQVSSSLSGPRQMAVDASGSIYIADTNNYRVLKETFSGGTYVESTVGSGLAEVDSVAVDAAGNVYIADTGNGRIVKLDYADAPSLTFPSTPIGVTSSEQTAVLQNIGNLPLAFPVPSSGSNPAVSPNFTLDGSVANACPQMTAGEGAGANLLPGASCALAIGFAPTTSGSLQGDVVIGDTNLNAANAMQSISMVGTGSVASANLTLSAPASATYGNPVQVTASVYETSSQSSITAGSVAFSDQNGSFGTQTVANGTASQSYLASAVGSFTLTGAFTPPNGNISKASGQTTLQVTPAPLNLLANGATRSYGATNPQFSGSITGAVNGDSFVESFKTSASATSAPGVYSIIPQATGANLSNYVQSVQNGALQVTPANLTVVANNATRSYGAANPQFNGTVTGAVNGDTLTESFTTTATSASPVATYSIVPSVSGPTAANYNPTIQNGTLSVTPASLTVSANNMTRTYGAANPTFTGSIAGAVNGDSFTETFTTAATQASSVANYPIVPAASGPALGNYTPTINNGTLTITPAMLAVKANDATRSYGATNPTFSGAITGAVNGDSFTESFTTNATQSSPVAAYSIVPSAAGQNLANYTQSATNGTLTITPANLAVSADNVTRAYGTENPVFTGTVQGTVAGDSFQESFSTQATANSPVGTYSVVPSVNGTALANYTQTIHNGTLAITPATLQLSANDASRSYGAANPVFIGAIAGLVGTDVLTEQFATPAKPASVPGTYAIVPSAQGAAMANYQVITSNGTLTVTPAPLTASVANTTRAYGAPNPSFTGSVTGAANQEAFTETFSTTATAQSPVGSYPVVPALAGATLPYYNPTLLQGTLTVTPAVLIIVPANVTRTYGTPNPQLTGTMTGVVNNDALQASFTTPATTTDAPGAYPILASLSGSALSNYSVQTAAAMLTITKASTTTTLVRSAATATNDGSITLQAQVQPATTGTPGGMVRFFNGKSELGEVPLQNGTAAFSTNQLHEGQPNALVAVYQGDANFQPSSSTSVLVVLTTTGFWLKPVAGAATATIQGGGKASFAIQVGPGTTGFYPGEVTFSVTGLPAGATATFSPQTLAPESGEQTVSLTLQTQSPATSASTARNDSTRHVLGRLEKAALALLLLPLAGARRLRRAGKGLALTLLLVLGGLVSGSAFTGCGYAPGTGWGNSTPAKPAPQQSTTYTLTVTMTSGGTSQTTTETLVLQQ